MRLLTNLVIRPLAWVIPVSLCARILDLPTDWRLWVLLFLSQWLEVLVMRMLPPAAKRQHPVEK